MQSCSGANELVMGGVERGPAGLIVLGFRILLLCLVTVTKPCECSCDWLLDAGEADGGEETDGGDIEEDDDDDDDDDDDEVDGIDDDDVDEDDDDDEDDADVDADDPDVSGADDEDDLRGVRG